MWLSVSSTCSLSSFVSDDDDEDSTGAASSSLAISSRRKSDHRRAAHTSAEQKRRDDIKVRLLMDLHTFTSFDFLCSSSFNHSNNHNLCPCLTSCGMMCLYAKLSLEGIGYFPQTSLNNLCRCAIYLYYATYSSRLMHEVDLRIIDVFCSMSNGEKAGTKTYSCKRNPLQDFWCQLEVGW